jgi:hypothetical protein
MKGGNPSRPVGGRQLPNLLLAKEGLGRQLPLKKNVFGRPTPNPLGGIGKTNPANEPVSLGLNIDSRALLYVFLKRKEIQ